MSKLSFQKLLNLRPLITETLPYEVPLIFSNDLFLTAIAEEGSDEEVHAILEKITPSAHRYTVPYNYSIRKNEEKDTVLSIIHPMMQLEIANFYKNYSETMLYHCKKSDFSLRRPAKIASIYSESFDREDDSRLKTGVVEERPETDLPDLSHLVSYFTYEKYNLLYRFVNSKEFLRYEKDFCFMRSIDISKCFYNIYTHSVTWAVKDKIFAKGNVHSYSFEGRMDKLMQLANYNETNGIVVGPEFSRIFAEIILQDVDKKVQLELEDEDLRLYADYVVRRYIDDYFIFANNEIVLDKISDCIKGILESYKLYLNSSKHKTAARPFLTNISAARIEVGEIMARLRAQLGEAAAGSISVNRALLKIRATVSENKIEICNISSWVLSSLHNLLRALFDKIGKDIKTANIEKTISSVVEMVYYICFLDYRVNITYKIGQILDTIYQNRKFLEDSVFDNLEYLIEDENIKLIKRGFNKAKSEDFEGDYIELYNIIIASVHFHDLNFMSNKDVQNILKNMCSRGRMTYFKFITLKFCFLKKRTEFQMEIDGLNHWAEQKIVDKDSLLENADQYLLFFDYISSPDIGDSDKLALVKRIFGGEHSKKAMELLSKKIGFTDWTGMRIHHLLCRKELRPVYS